MIDLTEANEYRELRVYVKPDNLHGAIDELLMIGAWDIKIEQLSEVDFDADPDMIADAPTTEFVLTATFGPKDKPALPGTDKENPA